MDYKGALSVVFILVITSVAVAYYFYNAKKPKTNSTQARPLSDLPSETLPLATLPSTGQLQTWQCFTKSDGTEQCANVFNNQGLPYTSVDRTVLQERKNYTPVWLCSTSGCFDVYNFIGKAF